MPTDILNILVIDDDKGDRIACQRALKSAFGDRARLLEADNGLAGLAIIEKDDLNCVLLDHSMPGINGVEVLKRIRGTHPYLAVIMIDGNGSDVIAVQAMKEGAQDYIQKANITGESIRRISGNAMDKAALQRQVAEQREQLENFARMLVHDLKAPTRSIRGFANIMEHNIREGKLADLVEHCRIVVKAAGRMDLLIDTLHQYTEADARVAFEPVEMNLVVRDALSNLDHVLRERGARVTHGDLPIVIGNAPQLGQLLQNLIGNGIKYCEAEIPSIHVAAARQSGAEWLFSVRDNGIGIPERYYQTIFEPFKRLHGSGKYEGTGLGLAACKKIIERHNGRIWCESIENIGTTMFFALPGSEAAS